MSDSTERSESDDDREPTGASTHDDTTDAFGEKVQDLRNRLKHLTQPLVDSLDSRLRDQIDRRVDDRVDDRVQTLVDEALAARLSVIERAIADIDRTLKELQAKQS